MSESGHNFDLSLPQLLASAAYRFPGRGIAVFENRGRNVARRTYPEILSHARRHAERLASLGVGPGDRVLVCLPTSWSQLDAWLGALLLQAWPVAMAPTGGVGGAEGQSSRIAAILERIGGKLMVTGEGLRSEIERTEKADLAARVITPETLKKTAPSERFRLPAEIDPQEVAFLQLTSGSTGFPRAVMITHRGTVHNTLAIDEAIGAPRGGPVHSWADSLVSWLPMHHDMGLIGCLWLAIHRGLDLWLLNPTTFLARPKLWLDTLGCQGSTFAHAPNFGYQLCVERIKSGDLEGLDLSSWHAAMTGAEMVRPETVAAFSELTERCGFRPQAFRPCYGLAEGTLAVTCDVRGEGLRTCALPEGAGSESGLSEVAALGPPVIDTEVVITAPDGTLLPEGRVGEVRAKGPGIFAGYFQDDEATSACLQDGWLLTGDLGFMHGGELHLTGRLKDLLIIRGNNVMPHELEWIAEEVAGGGGSNRSGAFSVPHSTEGEQPVLVMETGEKSEEALEQLGHEIRTRIGRRLSLPLADLVFVRRGRIPKTTSGKVKRGELRQRYLDQRIERLG